MKATRWPVPAICPKCHADVLVCPVVDGEYVVPLVVDAWPPGVQWDQESRGGFWKRVTAHMPHVCDEKEVAKVDKLDAEMAEEPPDCPVCGNEMGAVLDVGWRCAHDCKPEWYGG